MKNRRWLFATISETAAETAAKMGAAIEIDEFCTAWNMDTDFPHWDQVVLSYVNHAPLEIFHAPFAELHPCAIDPKARALAMERFNQSADLARSYGINRMVAHGGFLPNVYYPIWYEEQSSAFWREFLAGQPEAFEILIENVLEDDPESMLRMLDAINDPRAGICLDAGHANVVSKIPVIEWIDILGARIRHVHLHDNHGQRDEHLPPEQGSMDIQNIMKKLDEKAPEATITLECMDANGAAKWLARYKNP